MYVIAFGNDVNPAFRPSEMAGTPIVLQLISLFCCGKNRLIRYAAAFLVGWRLSCTHTPEGIGVYLVALHGLP